MDLYLTTPIISTQSRRLRLPNYIELTSKHDPQIGFIDHTAPHRLDQNHSILNDTI
jgi:hypothetical protein